MQNQHLICILYSFVLSLSFTWRIFEAAKTPRRANLQTRGEQCLPAAGRKPSRAW